MKYRPINAQLFVENRAKLITHFLPNSLAIFNSNDIMPTSADGVMPFRQHTDIFYLSGIDQEESILLLCPNAPNEKYREILFLKQTNEHIAVWEGHKYSKEEATQISGVKTILWLTDFEKIFHELAFYSNTIYLNTNEHLRATANVQTRDDRFIRWCKEKYPLHSYQRLSPFMHLLRAIKSETEIELIQEACNITEKGFRRVLKFVKPNVTEYEIEAEFIHEFIRNRSKGFAYDPIIASGSNSCVLHYIENSRVCKDGDVLLLDVAAEYANYASDMTRVIPVNGRFSERQKQVYRSVLKVLSAAEDMLVIGNSWHTYQKEVGRLVEGELISLGVLDKHDVKKQDPERPLYKKYFMHGTSHYLGLNVHDYGDFYRDFRAGMVFTCEPGIYLPEENIGIRLENNILITLEGNDNLMQNIPIEIEEIEDLMNE